VADNFLVKIDYLLCVLKVTFRNISVILQRSTLIVKQTNYLVKIIDLQQEID